MSPPARPGVPAPEVISSRLEIATWEAGRPIVRIYRGEYGPTGFNPTEGSARFRPVRDASGQVVPTAYGGEDVETAIAETLLRPTGPLATGARLLLLRSAVSGHEVAPVLPTRDLRLARLRGRGLTRLGLRPEHVSSCPDADYPYTAEWAQAIHDSPTKPDGIMWTSRQSDAASALVLWGDRVGEADLSEEAGRIPLDIEPGLEFVRLLADAAGFDFEG